MIGQCAMEVIAMLPWDNPIRMNDPGNGYVLSAYSGLGITEVRRLSYQGAQQHGYTDDGFRSSPRRFTLEWMIVGTGKRPLWDLDDLKSELYGIFRPRSNDPVPLRFITPSGRVRQSDVNLVSVMDAPSIDHLGYAAQKVTGVFESGEPSLYDPRLKTVEFSILFSEESSAGWDIPWDIPWNIGQSEILRTQTISYANLDPAADAAYPVIRIYGPILSPVIQNSTTGEYLKLTEDGGLQLLTDEWVEIDLRYGRKTAVNHTGVSVEQYLSSDSDMGSWHLAYNTEKLTDGTRCNGRNEIIVTGSNATLNSRVEIFYYDRYIGV